MSETSEFSLNAELPESSSSEGSIHEENYTEVLNLNYGSDNPSEHLSVDNSDCEIHSDEELLDTSHILFEFESLDALGQKNLEILQMDEQTVIKMGNKLYTGSSAKPIGSLIATDWNSSVTASTVIKFKENVLVEKT